VLLSAVLFLHCVVYKHANATHTTHPAVLRASGQQKLGLLLIVCTYWVFGMPFSLLLAFPAGWGVAGLFAGIAVVTTTQCVVQTVLQWRIDWHQQAADAAARVEALSSGESEVLILGGSSGRHGEVL
jgi:MATE family multidrug resistance protein